MPIVIDQKSTALLISLSRRADSIAVLKLKRAAKKVKRSREPSAQMFFIHSPV